MPHYSHGYSTRPKQKKRRWPIFTAIIGVLLVGSYCYYALTRTIMIPGHSEVISKSSEATSKSMIAWPNADKSAVGISDSEIIETHGEQSAVPTASVAKVITSLATLNKYPLKQGQKGQTITLSADDVALYNSYAERNGSLVRVQAGEKINQYQMIQALMLPSSNNMADTMATWAFGSLSKYSDAANKYLVKKNIKNTHVGTDASGFDPSTTSTPSDLIKIGELAINNPTLKEIVAQKEATNYPVAGTIRNTNILLGQNGIIGVKTGNSDEAGYVLLSASTTSINNTKPVIIAIVMGAETPAELFNSSRELQKSAQSNFSTVKFGTKSKPINYYKLPWGGKVAVAPQNNLSVKVWNGAKSSATLKLNNINSKSQKGQKAGSLSIPKSATSNLPPVSLILESTPVQPTALWRLTHPF